MLIKKRLDLFCIYFFVLGKKLILFFNKWIVILRQKERMDSIKR